MSVIFSLIFYDYYNHVSNAPATWVKNAFTRSRSYFFRSFDLSREKISLFASSHSIILLAFFMSWQGGWHSLRYNLDNDCKVPHTKNWAWVIICNFLGADDAFLALFLDTPEKLFIFLIYANYILEALTLSFPSFVTFRNISEQYFLFHYQLGFM